MKAYIFETDDELDEGTPIVIDDVHMLDISNGHITIQGLDLVGNPVCYDSYDMPQYVTLDHE